MPDSTKFRVRGHEVSRLEAFSDVVFGFALTLIVVSLEVPQSYGELMQIMRGFPAFAICFAILTWVWFCHHTFFRRYALTDEYTIFLNTVLLFLVLFYTYPLKFIFSIVTGQFHGGYGNSRTLFLIYGLGYAGIFAVLFLMYQHALRKREELELNAFELHETRTAMIMYSSYIGIGLLSCAIAMTATRGWIALAGLVYFLIGPVSAVIGYRRGVRRPVLAQES